MNDYIYYIVTEQGRSSKGYAYKTNVVYKLRHADRRTVIMEVSWKKYLSPVEALVMSKKLNTPIVDIMKARKEHASHE
jgi:hypothetical protein